MTVEIKLNLCKHRPPLDFHIEPHPRLKHYESKDTNYYTKTNKTANICAFASHLQLIRRHDTVLSVLGRF